MGAAASCYSIGIPIGFVFIRYILFLAYFCSMQEESSMSDLKLSTMCTGMLHRWISHRCGMTTRLQTYRTEAVVSKHDWKCDSQRKAMHGDYFADYCDEIIQDSIQLRF